MKNTKMLQWSELDFLKQEVRNAYADCHGDQDFEITSKIRNLNFRASRDISRDEAIEIMEKYVPSYNDFNPSLLKRLPEDCRVTIAREGSVCIYVSVPRGEGPDDIKVARELFEENPLEADECDEIIRVGEKSFPADEQTVDDHNGVEEIRMWWD